LISMLMGRSDQSYLEDPRNAIAGVGDDSGRVSDAGLPVSASSVLGHPAVWRCISLRARSCARIPCDVYRYEPGPVANKIVDTDHDAWKLLRRRPNAVMTPYRFKRIMFAHKDLYGNAYALIDWRANGRAVALYVLDPTQTFPRVDPETGQIMYGTIIRGQVKRFDTSQIFHLQGLSIEPSRGLDVVEQLRHAFGLAIAQRRYRSLFFRQNARPNVTLEAPPGLSDAARERIVAGWRKATNSVENAHRAVLLEDGVKVHEYSANLRENQVVELDEHELVQIANIFGVPPHKVGAKTNTSYKSLSEENQSFLDEGLDPDLVDFEEEAWIKLLSVREQQADSHFIEFNRRAFVRANMSQRGAFYNLGIQGGWLSRDEVRAAEGYNAIPGGEGQVFLEPLNMGRAGSVALTDEDPDAEKAPDAEDQASSRQQQWDHESRVLRHALVQVLARDCGRSVARLGQAAERHAKGGGNFLAWLDDSLEAEHGRTIRETLRNAAQGLGLAGDQLAANVLATCRQQLLDLAGTATAGQLPEKIHDWTTRSRLCAEQGTFCPGQPRG
jgi:HK97 family phage portal protein